jgi:glycine/D-amino acid oxidase-like deaminating enzyme
MQAVSHASLISHAERIRIIGQGLVGSLLALRLRAAGIPFVVQDVPLPGASTEVAPGIVNPLAGRHFRAPDRLPMLLEELDAAMQLAEDALGAPIWNPCPILRMFDEPTQVDRFRRGLSQAERAAYVAEQFAENTQADLNDLYGSFLTLRGGWANLPLLKNATRELLRREGRLEEQQWTVGQAPRRGEVTCFCDGWQVAKSPDWGFIPHNPAKGEMLVVRIDGALPRDRIYNQACWIQPIEPDLWRLGATYSWSHFNSDPTLDAAEDLQERLRLLTPLPFHVVDQLAGVRPIVEDYRPVIGQHPQRPDWFILNAMGSKGVLQAPACVSVLLGFMLEGKGIPPDWSVARFVPRG